MVTPSAPSWVAGAVDVHAEGVHGGRGCNEEMVALETAEAQVRHDLGKPHLAEQRAIRVEAVQAVVGSPPEPAVRVDTHPVEAPRIANGEDLTTTEPLGRDAEPADVSTP